MGKKKRSLGLFTPNIYWVLESIGANPTSLRHWFVCKRLMSSAETSINKPAVIAACRQCRNWANFRTFKYGTEAILDLSAVLLMLSGKELWSNLQVNQQFQGFLTTNSLSWDLPLKFIGYFVERFLKRSLWGCIWSQQCTHLKLVQIFQYPVISL